MFSFSLIAILNANYFMFVSSVSWRHHKQASQSIDLMNQVIIYTDDNQVNLFLRIFDPADNLIIIH